MIERADWGSGDLRDGGTGRQVATVARQSLDEVKPGEVVSGQELLRLHNNQPQDGKAIATALSPELVREMTNDVHGFAENLATLQTHAANWLKANCNDAASSQKFIEYFDELSVPLQGKILSVFRRNPSMSFERLSAKVRQRLTLEEAAEVSAWLRR